jgi:hypothetical protein
MSEDLFKHPSDYVLAIKSSGREACGSFPISQVIVKECCACLKAKEYAFGGRVEPRTAKKV